jgi:hypothetical protein
MLASLIYKGVDMNKKLVFALLAFIVILAIGLPYGAFTWNTSAQSYSGGGSTSNPNLPPPSNVVDYAGQSISYFLEDGQLAVYGECLATDGQCSRVALVNFNEIDSGDIIYEGDVTIRAYEIAPGIWQLNVYVSGVLIDDKSEVYVNEDGEAFLLLRRS